MIEHVDKCLPWTDNQCLLLGCPSASALRKPVIHAALTRAWFHKTSALSTSSNSISRTSANCRLLMGIGPRVPAKCPARCKLKATASLAIECCTVGSNFKWLAKSTVVMKHSEASKTITVHNKLQQLSLCQWTVLHFPTINSQLICRQYGAGTKVLSTSN